MNENQQTNTEDKIQDTEKEEIDIKEKIKREKLRRVVTVQSALLDVIQNELKESEGENSDE